ncbi:hypothetical protein EN817_08625 [Mesorhizobium sp. M3A.F.Ca.ET.174.01.1.1]|uniref:hypothetical protein n=1 Tax=unclassified Mesorhizobium TaxID=325217 RepID=UPI00109396B1|nr:MULTISPECIES: hypothetical protein [unclassified Mesorhizobium]TGS87466.1 hypothetical protein EN818_08625 [Mesorhizobium sp. M3A.F.Ca.ET.175.01.1.1]TGT27926.1 hypothetical protein EN817_08625 [Mesorhizobium sp. M3A.F.Ca.ET.174.01.1.1]
MQSLINRRLDTGYSTSDEMDLKNHIEQLRVLYGELPLYSPVTGLSSNLMKSFFGSNPSVPEESLEQFLLRIIDFKKGLIAKVAGVSSSYASALRIESALKTARLGRDGKATSKQEPIAK